MLGDVRIVSTALECYREARADLTLSEIAWPYRLTSTCLLVIYALSIILLEELMRRSFVDSTVLSNRAISILLITGVLVGLRRWLTLRGFYGAFGERYASRWPLVQFYRSDWLYLRYLIFRDQLLRQLAGERGYLERTDIDALSDFVNNESEQMGRLSATGFSAKYAAYGIGLFISLFSKMALKFAHPVLVDILIVIAAFVLFSNQLSSRMKTRSQGIAELQHFVHWLRHETSDIVEPAPDEDASQSDADATDS